MVRESIIILSALLWYTPSAASAIPPLTDEQSVRLETAHDGRDHQEEAFIALVENIRSWDGEISDAPVRIEPNIDAMLDEPDAFRGEIVRLTGRIAQVNALAMPHEGVLECFIRDHAGRPLLVYIVMASNDGDDAAMRLHEGRRIELFARFYKRVDFTARDGHQRQYAAFVGGHPRLLSPAATAGAEVTYLAIVSIAMLALLVVFVVLIVAARRRRREQRRAPSKRLSAESIPPQLDDTTDLPDDPAEALTELRRRMQHADS